MTIAKPTKILEEIEKQGVEDWIHNFLNNEGDNPEFSTGLKLEKRYYSNPIIMELSQFKRICGPEDEMKYKIDPEYFKEYIGRMKDSIDSGWEVPPLIIQFENGNFTLNDGNHRHAALTSMGLESYWVIFWTTEKKDFVALKDLYLQFAGHN